MVKRPPMVTVLHGVSFARHMGRSQHKGCDLKKRVDASFSVFFLFYRTDIDKSYTDKFRLNALEPICVAYVAGVRYLALGRK